MNLTDDQLKALKFARNRIQCGAKYICHAVAEFYKANDDAIEHEELNHAILVYGLRDKCTSFAGFVEAMHDDIVPIIQQARIRWLDEMIEKGDVTRADDHARWAYEQSQGPQGWQKRYDGKPAVRGPYDPA
ncbi:hypothetical protein BcepF1.025 [Burkholderia phage BcepF1]|uniref:Uncharacterized protein n=1 Tax=Burkholderia phage BcepF1 TaxID=2886897 RepID=A1YZS9_9CAUD|nr:hypothetical protein BcepF1.025 [Burkholderia phage BcepF1]ABL96756.1 hypothetical protein BcepF1.025 [Burkholderia phage BcepF1]